MSIINIHYRETDGEIGGWETGTPTPRDGLAIATVETIPDPKTQKIDTATKTLIDKTPVEVALASAPTLLDVQAKVARSLAASDAYMMPDRPLADTTRQAWTVYRQALRDLSKLPTPAAQLAAWPAIPS